MTGPDFDALVENGAYLVHGGYCSLDEITLPGSVDDPDDVPFIEEELRNAVRDYLAEHTDTLTEQENGSDPGTGEEDPFDRIDWVQLFDEFSLSDPNSVGNEYASKSQLKAAIESSYQNISTPAGEAIEQGVEEGDLTVVMKGDTVRGYVPASE